MLALRDKKGEEITICFIAQIQRCNKEREGVE